MRGADRKTLTIPRGARTSFREVAVLSVHVRRRNAIRTPQARSLTEQVRSAFTLFGALVAGAFFATALAYGVCWAWLTPEFERSRLAVRAESAAYAATLDEETGLRAYLMTRDPRFLEPYTSGEVALARANATLTASAGSVADLAVAMFGTRLAEEKWRDRWAHAAAAAPTDAVALSMSEGKALFDAYRSEEAVLANALDRRSEPFSRRDQQISPPA